MRWFSSFLKKPPLCSCPRMTIKGASVELQLQLSEGEGGRKAIYIYREREGGRERGTSTGKRTSLLGIEAEV